MKYRLGYHYQQFAVNPVALFQHTIKLIRLNQLRHREGNISVRQISLSSKQKYDDHCQDFINNLFESNTNHTNVHLTQPLALRFTFMLSSKVCFQEIPDGDNRHDAKCHYGFRLNFSACRANKEKFFYFLLLRQIFCHAGMKCNDIHVMGFRIHLLFKLN